MIGDKIHFRLAMRPDVLGYDPKGEPAQGMDVGHGLIVHRATWLRRTWCVSDRVTGSHIAASRWRRSAVREAYKRLHAVQIARGISSLDKVVSSARNAFLGIQEDAS